MTATVTVAEYLGHRLRSMGIEHLFGVPGDFNLALLDILTGGGPERHDVDRCRLGPDDTQRTAGGDAPGNAGTPWTADRPAGPRLRWVGSPNELNAGYAADAYARIRGAAAVVTTFGVGELSALNAVAGSYAEQVPVVQITGSPATATAASGSLTHHTLADGDFGRFARAYAEVTAAGAVLEQGRAAEQIDEVLAAAIRASRPVYLSIPVDVATSPVPAERLATPLPMPAVDTEAVAEFRTRAAALLAGAGRAVSEAGAGQAVLSGTGGVVPETRAGQALPADTGTAVPETRAGQAVLSGTGGVVLIAGHLVDRTRNRSALARLADRAGGPVVTLGSARGAFDSTHRLFAGVYCGALSAKPAILAVDNADIVIEAGTVMSDTLTGTFTHRDDPAHTIHLGLTVATVAGERFDGVPLGVALDVLSDLFAPDPAGANADPAGQATAHPHATVASTVPTALWLSAGQRPPDGRDTVPPDGRDTVPPDGHASGRPDGDLSAERYEPPARAGELPWAPSGAAPSPSNPAVEPAVSSAGARAGDPAIEPAGDAAGEVLDQALFWERLEDWMPAGHRLVVDIGTSYFGALGIRLPGGVDVVAQPTWASIGYALPATLGCALAEPARRPVLVIGDGAAQMTAQDLGSLARHGTCPVVIILDNSGYTIERGLASPRAVYHDVAAWDWCALARALAPGSDIYTARAGSTDELAGALDAAAANPHRMAVLHVRLDQMDMPPALRAMTQAYRT